MARRPRAGAKLSGLWWLGVAALCCASCATIFGPPDESPPEAPSARLMWRLAPGIRDQMWSQVFESRDYVERLVCPGGDPISAKRTAKKGLVETYEVDCPGEKPLALNIDVGYEPPSPPSGYRLLEVRSFARYKDAFALVEKKDFDGASKALDEAIKLAPNESVYRRDRIYLLLMMGQPADAFLQGEELLKEQPSPMLYKYRALAARDLGLRSEVMSSLDGMVRTSHVGHPLYAEAICGKGMMLAAEGDAQAERLMQQGCALDYKPCCDALENLRESTKPAKESPPPHADRTP